jgi:DNA-binding CsgD family transcriptional regulator
LDAGIAEVDVYEPAPRVEELGVGINVQPHAIRELSELGVLDDLSNRGIPTEQVISALPSMEPPGIERGPLTAREREVVELIANSCTNRQIAEALVVAEATAVRHVANILNKLNLTSRAAVDDTSLPRSPRPAVWSCSRAVLPRLAIEKRDDTDRIAVAS